MVVKTSFLKKLEMVLYVCLPGTEIQIIVKIGLNSEVKFKGIGSGEEEEGYKYER